MLVDTGIKGVLEMSFLIFSNADIRFAEKELVWRSSTTKKSCFLATTRRVKLIDRRKFAAALDGNKENVVVSLFPQNTSILLTSLKHIGIHDHAHDQVCRATKATSPLIKESLSCLGCSNRFTQLDLINLYHG